MDGQDIQDFKKDDFLISIASDCLVFASALILLILSIHV